jgi:hypothetical protein
MSFADANAYIRVEYNKIGFKVTKIRGFKIKVLKKGVRPPVKKTATQGRYKNSGQMCFTIQNTTIFKKKWKTAKFKKWKKSHICQIYSKSESLLANMLPDYLRMSCGSIIIDAFEYIIDVCILTTKH